MGLQLSEQYISLSGEAPDPGKPVLILRFSGCNLNCKDCDTPEREEMNLDISKDELGQLIDREVYSYPDLSILFTGGEPLLSHRKNALVEIMTDRPNINFYIETNGSQLIPSGPENTIYVIDLKPPSQEEAVFRWENIKKMRFYDCIKILTCKDDFNWILDTIKKIRTIRQDIKIYLSPIWGKIDFRDLADFILKNKLPVSLSLQNHKFIWGSRTRGV